MTNVEEKVRILRLLVVEARSRFNEANLHPHYVSHNVIPMLRDVLSDLRGHIEQHHKLCKSPDCEEPVREGEREDEELFPVVHYTSITAIIRMLEDHAKKHQARANKQGDRAKQSEGHLKNREALSDGASLRLYDSAHFNDPDEGNYLVRKIVPRQRYTWLRDSSAGNAYIASFIIPETNANAASDNLVFWRTYGREGKGCSLKLMIPKSRLWKVIYDPDDAKRTAQLLTPVLDVLDPLVTISDGGARRGFQESLAETFRETLGQILYSYKSQAYAYEHEARVIAIKPANDDIRFDYNKYGDSPFGIRHYLEPEYLNIKDILASGSSITLGPNVSERDDVRRSLKLLMGRSELYGPEVNVSNISYRKP